MIERSPTLQFPDPPLPVGGSGGRRQSLLISIGITALCLGLYANALPNAFIFDDVPTILNDERVTDFQMSRIWTEEYWGLGHKDKLYRPLITLSFALNWLVSHEPWAFRLPNLFLHIVVSILVYHFTRHVFNDARAAVLAGGLFAIHPIHTEPLNTIVGRADLAVTALTLVAALLWWRDGVERRDVDPSKPSESDVPKRGLWRPVLAALCFAAATLCKESAVTLLGVLLLLDWWYRRRVGKSLGRAWWLRRVIRCYIPLLLIVLGYLVVRQAVLGRLTSEAVVGRLENPINTSGEMLEENDHPFLVRWATPLYTFTKASWMMLWPRPLVHDYSIPALPAVRRFGDYRLWLGLGWLVALAMICARSFRRRGAVLAAVGLALIPYSIISNVVIVIGTIFAERLLYAPSTGVCMAVGLVLSPVLFHRIKDTGVRRDPAKLDAAPPRVRAWVAVPLAAVAVWYGYLTIERNTEWRSAQTLAFSVPDDGRASFKVVDAWAHKAILDGRRLEGQGDLEGAQTAYETALRYAEKAIVVAPDAWGPFSEQGIALAHLGRKEEAFAVLDKALRMGAGKDARTVFTASGLLVELRDDYGRAIFLLKHLLAITHPPPYLRARAHNDLAMYLINAPETVRDPRTGAPIPLRNPVEALVHAREAVRLAPGSGAVRDTLVQVLLVLGRREEAAGAIREALEAIPPDDPFHSDLRSLLGELAQE
jgi:Flp pilus assembly protein TadD